MPLFFRKKNSDKTQRNAVQIRLDDGSVVRLRFGNAQDIGSRDQQQDSFGYSDLSDAGETAGKGVLAVLADGMGGLSGGKQTSEYIVGAMLAMFRDFDCGADIPEQLRAMAVRINEQVYAANSENGSERTGSTLAAVLVCKTRLFWVCVGDSRAYLYRKGALYQLNEDHVYINQLLSGCIEGDLSLEEAKNDRQGHALTDFIGKPELRRIDSSIRGLALQRGDKILLCSDGVYNAVNNASLVECLRDEPHKAAAGIIREVLAKKLIGQDNVTALVIEYQ